MVKPGRRITIRHTPAFAARLLNVSQNEGEDRAKAYLRLALRGKVHREVSRQGHNSLVWVNGSRDNPFLVPTSAVKFVKVRKQRRS